MVKSGGARGAALREGGTLLEGDPEMLVLRE